MQYSSYCMQEVARKATDRNEKKFDLVYWEKIVF